MPTPNHPVFVEATAREQALIAALQAIVAETMAYPTTPPKSADSYLPEDMILAGIAALGAYGVLPVFGADTVKE